MSPVEKVTVEQLDAVSATRTATKRGEHSVWDITVTRGGDVVNRSITIKELLQQIAEETLRRLVRLAELNYARAVRTPPPTLEEPDPDWVDVVGIAQAALDAVDDLLHDLDYLRVLLEGGGER